MTKPLASLLLLYKGGEVQHVDDPQASSPFMEQLDGALATLRHMRRV